MNIIAIDCGASFLKAAKFQNGRLVRQLQARSPSAAGSLPQIEQIMVCIREILQELTEGEKEVLLGISNEMHGFLLAREDGTAFTDYISWQKEYGEIRPTTAEASPKEILEERFGGVPLQNTGMPLRAGLPSCNLLYLNQTETLNRDTKPYCFYTLGDYILRRLAGKSPMIHPTNAAASGLYDLTRNDWNDEIISCCSGTRVVFPSVGVEPVEFYFGETLIHAFPAIGDQQAALLGAGLEDVWTLSFNLGTGGQVSMLADRYEPEVGIQIRPYFGNRYLRTIPHIPSGRALNVYIRFVWDLLSVFHAKTEEEMIWKRILELEEKADAANLQCDLSFFENAVTKQNTGSISQIGEFDLTVSNLFHAVFQQMAQNYLCCADRLITASRGVDSILFSGGIARKIPRIREAIIARYSPEIPVIVAENETLIGINRYLGMLCDG